jgi:hypothetical protein
MIQFEKKTKKSFAHMLKDKKIVLAVNFKFKKERNVT